MAIRFCFRGCDPWVTKQFQLYVSSAKSRGTGIELPIGVDAHTAPPPGNAPEPVNGLAGVPEFTGRVRGRVELEAGRAKRERLGVSHVDTIEGAIQCRIVTMHGGSSISVLPFRERPTQGRESDEEWYSRLRS
jgi:hypothetical protein